MSAMKEKKSEHPKKERVLIIKTGWSELLHDEIDSRKVSLGDVLRTTVLLHRYSGDDVTWLTDEKAAPLLEGNPFIGRLVTIDYLTAPYLEQIDFDTVINLEKHPGICALVRNIHAWKKFGFRLDPRSGEIRSFEGSLNILTLSSREDVKRENKKTAQELLFEAVGAEWNEEEYVLGYTPTTEERYDVGFNTLVGQKWPTKAWDKANWDELELQLGPSFKVTRQDKQPKEGP